MAKKAKAEKATKLRKDVNEVAHRVMLEATGQSPKTPPPGERSEGEKNPEAVARGKKGGHVGGKVRGAKTTKDQRRKIARDAANRRWGKQPD